MTPRRPVHFPRETPMPYIASCSLDLSLSLPTMLVAYVLLSPYHRGSASGPSSHTLTIFVTLCFPDDWKTCEPKRKVHMEAVCTPGSSWRVVVMLCFLHPLICACHAFQIHVYGSHGRWVMSYIPTTCAHGTATAAQHKLLQVRFLICFTPFLCLLANLTRLSRTQSPASFWQILRFSM